jgi:hypothetical protein
MPLELRLCWWENCLASSPETGHSKDPASLLLGMYQENNSTYSPGGLHTSALFYLDRGGHH